MIHTPSLLLKLFLDTYVLTPYLRKRPKIQNRNPCKSFETFHLVIFFFKIDQQIH